MARITLGSLFISALLLTTLNAQNLFNASIFKQITDVGCGHRPADIVFLLDSSTSIWGPNFQRQLAFVSNVVDMFNIGFNQIRVGVSIFSSKVYPQFRLIDYPTKRSLQKAIRLIEQRNGDTNTAAAIRHMRLRMFKKRHGARRHVPHVGIIVTDGRSDNTLTTLLEANLARRSGISMFAIGIGSMVYNYELNAIASSPKEEYVFTVNSFEALGSIKKLLAKKTCQVTTPPPTTRRPTTTRRPRTTTIATTTTTTTTPRPIITTTSLAPPTTRAQSTTTMAHRWKFVYPDNHSDLWTARLRRVCGKKPADIALVLDSSSSVGKEAFWKQLRFLQEVVHVFNVAPDKARFAAISFADTAREEFELGKHSTVKGVSRAVARIEQMGGGLNTGKALEYLRKNVFLPKYARHNAARIAIILSNGNSDDSAEAKRQAKLAHQAGIYVFAIGVGPKIKEKQLNTIASKPSEKYVLQVKSFQALRSVIDIVSLAACKLDPPLLRPLPSDEACGTKDATDLMFVVDSPNAGVRNTKKAMKFLENIVEKLAISEEKVQIGTISDPCDRPQGIQLKEIQDKNTVKGKMETMEFNDISSLMKEMRMEALTAGSANRSGAKKIALIIVDGDLAHPLRALTEAQRARFHGIEVYVVSVGPVVDPRELSSMCSTPGPDHFFKVDSYDDLEGISKDLLEKMCGDTV